MTEPQTKTVFIGHNPMRTYLIACLTALASGNKRLVLKARGQAITTLVDTTEVLKRQNPLVKVESITVGTDVVQDQRTQRDKNISTMEIVVSI
jgi:DNA-binding protein Alba